MKNSALLKTILLFFILLATVNAYPQQSSAITDAKFKKYAVDETGTLSTAQLQELNDKLYNFDLQTSNQIIVYIISTLDNESLEDVSVRLAEKNKIGKKDRNNGVLMLVVKDDRKIRLEVGYGLEGALTDALSSQIIRKEITPSFKEGNYFEGINNGINSIISVTKNEYKADPKQKGTNSIPSILIIIFVFGFIFLSIVIGIIRRVTGVGKRFYTGSSGFGGFWGSGGSGGSGWGGGDSGGFSGGGGSFGGGGASGSW
ncbi:hypothetical protein BH10BAC5_BH10BAC5_11710 [soil metagenome]